MDPESAVKWLSALAAVSFLIGAVAVARALWRARGFPKTALQMLSLAGGFFCLVVGSTLLFLGYHFKNRVQESIDFTGRPAPVLHYLPPGGGATISSETWKGTPVLLNVWATWCKPCREELPALARYQQEKGTAVRVLAVSDETPKTVAEYLKENPVPGLEFAVVARGVKDPAPFFFTVPARPVSFAVDAAGVIRGSHLGAMSDDQIRRLMALTQN